MTVVPVGAEATDQVLAVVREAFGARPRLDPPADATQETAETLRARLAGAGGLLAELDGRPAGALVLDLDGTSLHLRRFGVVPAAQGHGVARLLVDAAAGRAAELGCDSLAVTAREELPETIRFWTAQGFEEVGRTAPNVELRRPLYGGTFSAPDADAMRGLGGRLARWVRGGDLVVLTGPLAAGKTTFTQGLGAGLGVRGAVTSPTFVIARVHPSEVRGPDLVHVDAYRIGGLAELDDLDLDADLDHAVTVVEWGEGLAESLADSRLEVRIERADDTADEARTVRITPVGPRWSRSPA